MNRRTWLSSLLALPLIPSVLRAASEPAQTAMSVRILNGRYKEGWIEFKGEGDGRIELVVHEQADTGYGGYILHNVKPSKDVWWSCQAEDGTHVSFIGSQDMGSAELKERTRLAMEAVKS